MAKRYKRREYTNGYSAKLDYWYGQLVAANAAGDWGMILKAMGKLTWFNEKQTQLKDQALEKFLNK
jgi:hypothetical protein